MITWSIDYDNIKYIYTDDAYMKYKVWSHGYRLWLHGVNI